jgi:hypothetical protein
MRKDSLFLMAFFILAVATISAWRGWPTSAQQAPQINGMFSSQTEVATTFTVTNTAVSGAGSLRQVILDANGNAGADSINFNIPASDPNCNGTTHVCTIKPNTDFPLPPITDRVTIDGYSQPGASVNTLANGDDAILLIEIDGSLHTSSNIAFLLQGSSGGSTIRGLVIDNWSSGILTQTDTLAVEGCFIGIDPSGTAARPTNIGIFADFNTPTSGMRIGGTSPAARNVISGNNTAIFFQSGSNHVVQGNFLGTDRNGTASIANGTGVSIQGSNDDLIGGTSVQARNIIASGRGVFAGLAARTRIQGNFIGTDVTGTVGFGNAFTAGVVLDSSDSDTMIGGLTSTPGTPPGNVISGGNGTGITIGAVGSVTGTTVMGNLIGTNSAGTSALGNLRGIVIVDPSNSIGGTDPMARNVISSNVLTGILIQSQNNQVQGNFIGTDITGTQMLGNGGDGVLVQANNGPANNNTIGGISPAAGQDPGNTIAGNGGQGVSVNGPIGIAVLGNSMHSNGALGIDLGADGVTANDDCDGDPGSNNRQNFPVITSATYGGGIVNISGTLDSELTTTYRLEFFSSALGDPLGNGEGATFLGSTNITTNPCTASFGPLPFALPIGQAIISATATKLNVSLNPIETSEFSPFVRVLTSRADFDGDGRTDLSVFRPSEGNWYLNGSTSGFGVIKWGISTDMLVPGDYNGDGITDTAVFRPDVDPANTDYYILNSTTFTFSGISWGLPGDIPVIGDYDGDGKTDLAVFRPSESRWYILNSSNGSNIIALFGQSGDIPLAIDNDGDGKTNLAVFRPGNASWYIARPTGVPAQNFDAIPFGLLTDKLVPADYDGDGKDDIAVYRPSNGTWHIRRSSNGAVDFIPFGISTDVPVPGDYDGDAKDDVAVYRNGLWFVNRSTSGLLIQPFGLSTDTAIPSKYIH